MSNHVSEWLNAYYDGELKGARLHQVEEHLAACEACQAEFESLQGLSALLQEAPTAQFISNERFVSQVNLRLPQRRVSATRQRLFEVGWWMAPVGLLMIWIFISTTIFISDMVSAANKFGLLDDAAPLLVSDSSAGMWTSTLGQFGLLEGEGLQWAERIEIYTRNVLPQFVWQVSIAMLYLTWIAISWVRQRRQGQVPLLES